MTLIRGRDFRDGRWLEVELAGEIIGSVRSVDTPTDHARDSDPDDDDDWIAPAFWDLQTNGRWGYSFSSPELNVAKAAELIRGHGPLGVARLCPTLITAPVDVMIHGVATIAAACDTFPDVAKRVVGIHLEGPFLSQRDGYRGAHPAESMGDPNWELFERLQDASGRRIRLITLAPERRGAIDFIRRATASGVVVALGHTAADSQTIQAAIEAGAALSTHLGNGIASPLERHPNPIWEQAAADSLTASFIADGHHLDDATLRVLVRSKGPDRTILVSDASPLAGLPPGQYGTWAVDPSGKIVVAGTPYLAGSNHDLMVGLDRLRRVSGWSLERVIDTVTRNPARLLGEPAPEIVAGERADLIIFGRRDRGMLTLKTVFVQGRREL